MALAGLPGTVTAAPAGSDGLGGVDLLWRVVWRGRLHEGALHLREVFRRNLQIVSFEVTVNFHKSFHHH